MRKRGVSFLCFRRGTSRTGARPVDTGKGYPRTGPAVEAQTGESAKQRARALPYIPRLRYLQAMQSDIRPLEIEAVRIAKERVRPCDPLQGAQHQLRVVGRRVHGLPERLDRPSLVRRAEQGLAETDVQPAYKRAGGGVQRHPEALLRALPVAEVAQAPGRVVEGLSVLGIFLQQALEQVVCPPVILDLVQVPGPLAQELVRRGGPGGANEDDRCDQR